MRPKVLLGLVVLVPAFTFGGTAHANSWYEKARFHEDLAALFCRKLTPDVIGNQRKERRLGMEIAMEMLDKGWDPDQFKQYMEGDKNALQAMKAAQKKCPKKFEVSRK